MVILDEITLPHLGTMSHGIQHSCENDQIKFPFILWICYVPFAKSIKQEPIAHGPIKPHPPIPKVVKDDMIWWCEYNFIIINEKPLKRWQNTCYWCPNLWYNHLDGFSNRACNEPMSSIFVNHCTKKHVLLEICLRFKAIAKGNLPTIARQRNIFARNRRWDNHPVSNTQTPPLYVSSNVPCIQNLIC